MPVASSPVQARVRVATPEGVEIELVTAGLGSRTLAILLDLVIQAGVIFALAATGGGVAGAAGATGGGWAIAALAVAVFMVLFGWDVTWETLNRGRTPGKAANHLRVVRADGRPVGFTASAVRNLLRIADLMPGIGLVGMVTVIATARNQRLGDLAAGTLVVRERPGGRPPDAATEAWSATPTVPVDAVATWDVTAITHDELTAVRHFLERRLFLPSGVRWELGSDLASRLAPQVPGAPADTHPEYLLEGIVAAKSGRR